MSIALESRDWSVPAEESRPVRGQRQTKDNKLVEDHLHLVKHTVFQVAVAFPSFVDREELARAGALGLVEAARRYDPARGVPFDRYAARRIRGAILDSVRQSDWAPRSVRRLARQLEAAEQELANSLGRMPNADETAEALGITKVELQRQRDRVFRSVVLALDYRADQDDTEELRILDVLPDDSTLQPAEELEVRELLSYLNDAVSLLPERHRLVVIGYFMENRTSTELAAFLDVTESRISQLRTEALEMLRAAIKAQYEPTADDAKPLGRSALRARQYARDVGAASDWRSRIDLTTEPSTRIQALFNS